MPLTYRDKGTSGTQIEVRTGNVSIGYIGKEMFSNFAGGGPRWRWYLTINDSAVPRGFARAGEAGTCEDAKAKLERNWQVWLTAAGLSER